MKKKHRILAVVFAALLAASACSMSVFAAASSTPSEPCPVVYQEDEPAVPLTAEEEAVLFANADFNLTENPDYFQVTSGNSQSGNLWVISEQGNDSFNGELWGENSVYTDYLLTDQDSYTVTVHCSSASGSPIACVGYDASSNNKYINGITVGPGESKTLKLTGLSKTSKVFLTFTGLSDSDTTTRISGTVS